VPQLLLTLNRVYHQKIAVTSPIIKAAYNPTKGGNLPKLQNDISNGGNVASTPKIWYFKKLHNKDCFICEIKIYEWRLNRTKE
jgi:hypothetical protein